MQFVVSIMLFLLFGVQVSASELSAPELNTLEQTASELSVPELSVAKASAPDQTVSELSISESSASKTIAPERSTAEQSTSEQIVSELSASKSVAPERSTAEQTVLEMSTSEESTPEQAVSELSVSDLMAMDETAESFPNLKTLQVAHKGKVVWSKAYHKANMKAATNIKSASKSLMSLLVGMAIEHDVIDGVDQPIAPLFAKQLPENPDSRLNDITIGHLLSMQAGLKEASGRSYGRWVISDNWVKEFLSWPFVEKVGGNMQYSTGNTHLLSAILMQKSGQHTYRLANKWLKGSGVHIRSWETDPQGIPMGGNQVSMQPASLLAFGELYRRGGVTKSGQRLISEEWIKESWTPRTHSKFHNTPYGYGWFIQKFSGVQGYFGWGYGGQMIYVLPELDLTIAITSLDHLPSGSTGYLDLLHNMVSRDIVSVIR